MKLDRVVIKNFGKFTNKNKIQIEGKIASIIGENGTGKSSILFVIKLLLDRNTRKKGVSIEWIPNIDLESSFEYIFDSKGFEKIGMTLPIEENRKIKIKIILKLDKDDNVFYPIIYIGEIEKLKYNHIQKLPFDDFFELIQINPKFLDNINKWIESHFKDSEILKIIDEKISIMNGDISKIPSINKFNKDENQNLLKITKKKEFKISLEANIQSTKIGKALNVFSKYNDNKIVTHGDGFDKIISIISSWHQATNEKIKIIIIDELENHFFYAYQSKIIDYLNELLNKENNNISQIILSTHSPNIIKIIPNTSIIKLMPKSEAKFFIFDEKTNYDYYQKDLITAIFYNKILIVEGHSEKMFYEYLFKKNEFLKAKIDTSEIYILNNQGIYFDNIVTFLKKMTNKIAIITDNDVWKNECQGLKRVYKLLKNNEIKIENFKEDFKEDFISKHESIVQKIIDEGAKNLIFIQDKIGDSFEETLLSDKLINQKQMEELKKGKLKNLSKFIEEISLKITNDKIKNSNYLFKWIKGLRDGK